MLFSVQLAWEKGAIFHSVFHVGPYTVYNTVVRQQFKICWKQWNIKAKKNLRDRMKKRHNKLQIKVVRLGLNSW